VFIKYAWMQDSTKPTTWWHWHRTFWFLKPNMALECLVRFRPNFIQSVSVWYLSNANMGV